MHSPQPVFLLHRSTALHRLPGHELKPQSQAAKDQDRCGYVPLWHPEDKPYRDLVKAAHCPSQPCGLPENVSFGRVRDSDISTAEAIFDLGFSSKVKMKDA